jgi:hypothetical protein
MGASLPHEKGSGKLDVHKVPFYGLLPTRNHEESGIMKSADDQYVSVKMRRTDYERLKKLIVSLTHRGTDTIPINLYHPAADGLKINIVSVLGMAVRALKSIVG